jgi:hypothetical protein
VVAAGNLALAGFASFDVLVLGWVTCAANNWTKQQNNMVESSFCSFIVLEYFDINTKYFLASGQVEANIEKQI